MKIRSLMISALALFAICSQAQAREWKISDVSILYPAIAPDWVYLELVQDKLIPASVMEEIGLRNSDWHLTSVRLDPCAKNKDGVCEREIRLVLQPQFPRGFRDSGLHIIYTYSVEQWESVLKSWNRLRDLVPTTDLVEEHPVFSHLGENYDKIQFLNGTLIQTLKRGNLTRIATMLRSGTDWDFENFELSSEGKFELTLIPHTHSTHQRFLAAMNQESFAFISPRIERIDSFLDLVRSTKIKEALALPSDSVPFQKIKGDFEMAESIVVDTANDRFNTDCTSCHVASQARYFAIETFAKIDPDGSKPFPFSMTEFENVSPVKSRFLDVISFGWSNWRASISDRVITESRESVERLNQQQN